MIDFNEILNEVCWQLRDGTIDLKNKEHLQLLKHALYERNIKREVVEGILENLRNPKKEK